MCVCVHTYLIQIHTFVRVDRKMLSFTMRAAQHVLRERSWGALTAGPARCCTRAAQLQSSCEWRLVGAAVNPTVVPISARWRGTASLCTLSAITRRQLAEPAAVSAVGSVDTTVSVWNSAGQRRTVFVQTQTTPNPDSLMFIPGQAVMDSSVSGSSTRDFASARAAMDSPLAIRLFRIDGTSVLTQDRCGRACASTLIAMTRTGGCGRRRQTVMAGENRKTITSRELSQRGLKHRWRKWFCLRSHRHNRRMEFVFRILMVAGVWRLRKVVYTVWR